MSGTAYTAFALERPVTRAKFFRDTPRWGPQEVLTAMNNALSRRVLRLAWPIADQLDGALGRMDSALKAFTPSPDSTPRSLALALHETTAAYNTLMERLHVLPLVREKACAELQQILRNKHPSLRDAGLSTTQDTTRLLLDERTFRAGLSEAHVRELLWGENGLVTEWKTQLDAIRAEGVQALLDPATSIEDVPAAWRSVTDLERRGALIDLLSSDRQGPETLQPQSLIKTST